MRWFSYFKLSPVANMKLHDSLRTETTKLSLIQLPISDLSHHQTVQIFMQLHARTLSVSLPLQPKTVQALIEEALQQLNQVYHLDLPLSAEEYALYAARRNGKKCRDFPSLDEKQNILLTNLKFYALVKKNQVSQHVTYPLSHINLELQKKIEKKVKKNSACFCIF